MTTRNRHLRFVVCCLVLSSVVLATGSCSAQPEPDDFTVDNETGFLAACADPVEDSGLTNAICRCIFEQTSDDYSFVDFQQLDATLKANPEAELPSDIQTIIATCIVDEADL